MAPFFSLAALLGARLTADVFDADVEARAHPSRRHGIHDATLTHACAAPDELPPVYGLRYHEWPVQLCVFRPWRSGEFRVDEADGNAGSTGGGAACPCPLGT
jgi:hypothetical protein